MGAAKDTAHLPPLSSAEVNSSGIISPLNFQWKSPQLLSFLPSTHIDEDRPEKSSLCQVSSYTVPFSYAKS